MQEPNALLVAGWSLTPSSLQQSLVRFDNSRAWQREASMIDAISALLSGVLLVLLSMLGGGIVYFLLRDFVKRHIRNKDQGESS
jgi:hypothetical protein